MVCDYKSLYNCIQYIIMQPSESDEEVKRVAGGGG